MISYTKVALGLPFLLFFILWLPTDFLHLMDEYTFLWWHSRPEGMSLMEWEELISIRPVFVLLNQVFFSTGFILHYNKVLILASFLVTLWGLYLLVEWLREEIFPDLDPKNLPLLSALAFVTFALFPSHHENLYWSFCFPYTLGLPLMVFGLKTKKAYAKILFFFLSISCLETWILPIAFLSGLKPVWEFFGSKRRALRAKDVLNPLLVFLAAFGLYLLMKHTLAPITGAKGLDRVSTSAGLSQLQMRFEWLNQWVWHVHFYRTFWIQTALTYLTFGAIGGFLIYRKTLTPLQLFLLFALPFLTAAHVMVMKYHAPRAAFGGSIVKCAVMTVLIMAFAHSAKRALSYSIIAVLLIAHLSITGLIFTIKTENFARMKEIESDAIAQLKSCPQTNCTIIVDNPSGVMKHDWTFYPEYNDDLFYRLRNQHAPQVKDFIFRFR